MLVYISHYACTYFGYLGLSTLEVTRLHVTFKVEFLNSVVTKAVSVHIHVGVNNLYVYIFGPALRQVVRILCLEYLKHKHINACTKHSVLLINLFSLSLECTG